MTRDLSHRAAFESHGETYTRKLAEKDNEIGHEARAWLAEREVERAETFALMRDKREEEILSIAKQANEIASNASKAASEQARWAMWAVLIALVAAFIAAAAFVQKYP
jgi:hypothetical protein